MNKRLSFLRPAYLTSLLLFFATIGFSQNRIAYVSTITSPYPWGQNTLLINQMNAVFGAGNWEDLRFETVDPNELFSNNEFCFVYLEGSDAGANEFNSFYQANLPIIEAFVQNGGRLLVNAAPNEGGNINYGFGGVQLIYPSFENSVVATDPAHPIWNGPFAPTATNMTGTAYGHAVICPPGMTATPIIEGDISGNDVLVEYFYGNGLVLFGGMTTTNFHSPQPQAGNVRQNILDYGKNASLQGNRIAYLSSNTNPYPWGQQTLITSQMDAVFGAGNWEDLRFENIGPDTIFGPMYCAIYLEGSDGGANAFNTFYQNNVSLIENYVQGGGRLFVNAAPNQGGNINLGFGGVILNYPSFEGSVVATNPLHPVFVGPFTPTAANMNGSWYGHAIVCPPGMTATPIIEGDPSGSDVLVEYFYGQGLVLFGGMTTTNFHTPQPAAGNVRMNILDYVKNAAVEEDECDCPRDTEAPNMVCQDATVELDENGDGVLVPGDIDGGSTDNCSPNVMLSASMTEFNCTNIGENTVILTGTDECGNSATCTAIVTVEDNLPPVFTSCPNNMTFSLDPGLCDIVFNYDVEAIDNCAEEAFMEDQTGEQELALFNLTCGFAFENVSYLRAYPGRTGAIVIDSVISGVSQATAAGPLTVNVYEYNGAGINFANFTFAGGSSVAVPAGTITTLYNFPVNAVLSPGSDYVIETVAQSSVFGGVFVGLNPGGETEPTYVACSQVVLGNLDNLGFQNGVIQYVYGREVIAGGPVPVVPDPNNQFQSGDVLPIGGPYTFRYEACDNSGNCSTCEFTVFVEDFATPIRHLACNDNIQISLDENCEAVIGADLILEGGPYGCYDNYIVTIQGKPSNVLGRADIGRKFTVTVTDPETGNACWGRISVEDKLPPRLLCLDTVIGCSADLLPSNLGYPVPEGAEVINTGSATCPVFVFRNFDNCTDVELRYKDWVTQGDCGSGYDRIITRNWTAVDDFGNESRCVQTIIVELGTLRRVGAPCNFDDLDMPSLRCDEMRDDSKDFSSHIVRWFDGCVDDYLVDQEVLDSTGRRLPMDSIGWNFLDRGPYAGHPSPHSIYWDAHPDFLSTCRCWGPNEVVKWFGTGLPVGAAACSNMQYTYKDSRFEIADNNCDAGDVGCYKLLRQWTILDWCTGEIAGHNQVIKVTDDEGPEITYPGRVTVGMDVWSCEGTWDVPAPWIVDNCSNDTRYEVEVLTGNVFVKPNGQWRVTNLAPGEHTAYITAYDCCGNATTVEVILNVVDDAPPVAVCEAHTVVSIPGGQDPNNAFAKIFAETFDDGSHDNCGPVWFKVVRMIKGACDEINGDDDPVVPGYQEYPDDYAKFCCEDVGQTIQVRFLVFDVDPGPGPVNENLLRPNRPLFGRYTECMVEVFVQDKVQPTVVAPPTIVVSCDFWFDINSLTDPNDATFGRVVTNLANREKVKTTDVVCPEWCEPNFKFNYFPPAGLEDKCALYDPVHPEFTYEHLWGFDGYALSSCGVMPIIIVNDQRECGQGRITRTISVPGGTGPVTATQTIFFVDCNKYYINDENCFDFDDEDGVIWPCDVELRECEASTDPDITGRPEIINEDNCSLVAVKYEDWVFDVVPNACFKIIRKWTILDWCQYDPRINLLDGRWEYDQIILVNDAVKPVLFGCEDVTFCDDGAYYDPAVGSCVGRAELMLDSVADCTPYDDLVFEYKIDAFNDGTYDFISSEYTQVVDNNPFADDESNARDASGVYPIGTHRIKWFVEDMCGNLQTCEYLFTVEDCKKPTPYCRTGIITVVMPSTGCISIWASDFDIGSFDNCPGDLTFAFDTIGLEQERMICCDSLEGRGGIRTIEYRVYVIDANGNYDYCTTSITVTDNDNRCDTMSFPIKIDGEVSLLKGNRPGMKDVAVRLYDNSNQMIDALKSGNSGIYAFTQLASGADYVVEPMKNDDPLNGVSTKDLIAIQRHLLGQSELVYPEQLIAADINRSNSISAKDLIELRKLILGIYDSFEEIHPDQKSWRFVSANNSFSDPKNPWDFSESDEFKRLMSEGAADFHGVKIGDIDGNATYGVSGGLSSREQDKLYLSSTDKAVNTGDQVLFRPSFERLIGATGYQLTIEFNASALEFVDLKLIGASLSEGNFGLNRLDDGVITVSWNGVTETLSEEHPFEVEFKAKSNGQIKDLIDITSMVTRAEAYFAEGSDMGLEIRFESDVKALDFELYQNTPNPWTDQTLISYNIPMASEVRITVYDVHGKIVRLIEADATEGYNEVTLDRDQLPTSGVYYYQLDVDQFSTTKKMIVIR
jgi:hypothetical protein